MRNCRLCDNELEKNDVEYCSECDKKCIACGREMDISEEICSECNAEAEFDAKYGEQIENYEKAKKKEIDEQDESERKENEEYAEEFARENIKENEEE